MIGVNVRGGEVTGVPIFTSKGWVRVTIAQLWGTAAPYVGTRPTYLLV